MPLHKGLPAPAERFYREVYGESVLVITSAVISGSAQLRPLGGLPLPSRFRFTHDAGEDEGHSI
jgi:hypothetical protein